jgi:hypothetical protein
VRESQIILGWKQEGRQEAEVETWRDVLLEVIRVKWQDPVPDPMRLAIEGTNDLDILKRWFRAALRATTLAEFRAAMTPPP